MGASIHSAASATAIDGEHRQLGLLKDLHASVRALLDALQDQRADEIEQQVHALESRCAAISARRHHERAHLSQPATSADASDTLLNAVAEVRGALHVARLFLAKLRRTNAVMLQVHAVAEGVYRTGEPAFGLRQ